MRTQSIMLVLVMTVCCGYAGQDRLPQSTDDYVQRVMKTFQVPGIGLAVVKDSKVLMAKGYGIRHMHGSDAVDENTLFGIASNTKAFTATALALLVEEGKINWDAPVVDYLPWLQLYDPYATRELTVRDLLVHRSGLGLGAGDLLWWPASTLQRKEIVRRLRHIQPAASFRSRYAYNNLMYVVAGEVIEAVSGQTWEEFVTNRILQPLGMHHSIVRCSESAHSRNIAAPHAIVEGVLQPVAPFVGDNANPAAGIHAGAADMAKWMIVQLDSGRLANGATLFAKNTTQQLWAWVTPQPISEPPVELAPLKTHFRGYALGFGVRDYRGKKLVYHTGGLPGYVSKMTLVPEMKLGIVVLTNQESIEAFEAITQYLLDHFLGAKPHDWISAYVKVKTRADSLVEAEAKKQQQERNRTSRPSLPLAEYAGTYEDNWYGKMMISLDREKLQMQFAHTPSLKGDLQHWHYDTFMVRWHDRQLRADAFVTFILNAEGRIDQVKMAPVSSNTDFSFDFKDLLFKPVKK